jgi:hypothetical protein
MEPSPTMEEVETRRDLSQQTRHMSTNLNGSSVRLLNGLFTIEIERAPTEPDLALHTTPPSSPTKFENLNSISAIVSIYIPQIRGFYETGGLKSPTLEEGVFFLESFTVINPF